MLTRLRRQPDPQGLRRLEQLAKERMPPVGILDTLSDAEHWLRWTQRFMPRIRHWKDLHLYRPGPDSRYAHIDVLFTAQVDWALIEALLPDMLRVALSVKAGAHQALRHPAPAGHV